MVSVKEAANVLNVSPARVRRLIADGEIPALKIGNAWALEEKDVLDRLSRRPRAGRPRTTDADGGVVGPRGAAPGEADRVERAKALYRECREALSSIPDAAMIAAAESGEEASFYIAVSDFFLQQRQHRLVSQGVF